MRWLRKIVDFALLHQKPHPLTARNFLLVFLSGMTAISLVLLLAVVVLGPLLLFLAPVGNWRWIGLAIFALELMLFWTLKTFWED